MLRPATIITHFSCKQKTATTIIYDQDNGKSFREMVKVDEQGVVKEYKFKWLGNANKVRIVQNEC